MAKETKKATDNLRTKWAKELMNYVDLCGAMVCQTAAGTFMFTAVDEDGEDRWVKVSIIIPKEASEENGTDGFSLADEYQMKLDKAAARKLEAERKSTERKSKAKNPPAKLEKWEN